MSRSGEDLPALFVSLGGMFNFFSQDQAIALGVMGLVITMSIHLARNVGRANRDLETQLIQVEELSAKNLKQERALREEAEKELQDAHDMQMGLMPTESPQISGIDLVGRCIPANHVGGDFFQYFPLSQDRLSIALADVTGHAMKAAVPVMMFSGILKTETRHGDSIENLFTNLNRTLHEVLERRTFVCFTMAELNPETRTFRMSNCGCPNPYHYRAARHEVVELQMDGYGYPLGIRPNATYEAIETQLEPGDRVVFCSDGIVEAGNTAGEMFTFERTAETIRQGCQEGLSAEALLERIISEVKAFTGEEPQGDDQTVVVLHIEA
jgi:sigma-B regulation protein RsbU (phosphoserine phosphatase)